MTTDKNGRKARKQAVETLNTAVELGDQHPVRVDLRQPVGVGRVDRGPPVRGHRAEEPWQEPVSRHVGERGPPVWVGEQALPDQGAHHPAPVPAGDHVGGNAHPLTVDGL